MTYVTVNLAKPAGASPGAGGNIQSELVMIDIDQVNKTAGIFDWPARDAGGIKMVAGDIVMKPGQKQITVYGTHGTHSLATKSNGDPDAKTMIHTVKFTHPGSELEVLEFRNNWLNKNVAIGVYRCNDPSNKKLYGTPCAPLQLQLNAEENKDKNTNEFTFESLNGGPDVAIYTGNFDFEDGSSSI